ncbi:MAG TPA: ABC-F family ATP-binding cassette domain-containing protein [Kofleriaceae bacterium]|nr:ABC-F family ATP-binding cassette domain-containing protein [Kofleriaceae bacterium]
MPVLTASELYKSYGDRELLGGISLAIRRGERVGLVGANGAGKSTLARILAGVETPDGGTVAVRGGCDVLYLAQEPVLDPTRTPRQLVLAGLTAWSDAKARHDEASERMSRDDGGLEALLEQQGRAAADIERHGGWDVLHRVDAILAHLDVPRPDDPVGPMSGGEQRRVALARILVARPALAILDEPTNHLDIDAIEWLEQHLIESGMAVLLITHDRYVLDRVVTRTLELEAGALHAAAGGWEAFLEAKADRLAHAARAEANRQNFLRRELEWLRRGPAARTTKQKARIQRAETVIAADPIGPGTSEVRGLAITEARAGKSVVEFRGVALELGGHRLIEEFELIVRKGQIYGVVGPNGAGKTSLLRMVLGQLAPTAGQVVVGQTIEIAYFDQTRSGLDDEASIFDNVVGKQGAIRLGDQEISPYTYLERFAFPTHRHGTKVGSLSGGERARVALARLLAQPANLLLFDEPTNDLDATTLGAIEELLTDTGATAIVVTHDRYFLDRVATAILAFEGDGAVVAYPGNYSMYRSLRRQAARQTEQPAPVEKAVTVPAPRSTPPKKLSYGEQRELDGMLDRIDEAEHAVAAAEAALADPALYAERGAEVPAARELLAQAQTALEALLTRWEELEAKRASL